MTAREPEGPGPDSLRPLLQYGRPRLVAFDYDGTLTLAGRPTDDVLAALARARATGLIVVLITGRIMDELRAEFPDVADHFDALVLENGALIDIGSRHVTTAPPIDPAVSAALTSRQIEHRTGNVIVAASAADEHVIVDELNRLGLEYQTIHNRSELMVVPSGINKGVGLEAVLAELGISPHDTVVVGDAENDHSLLAAAALGVAVANAVHSLRSAADVVIDSADGVGIIELVDDLLETAVFWQRRRQQQITLGDDDDGDPVRIPAQPANLIVSGGSGDGKSYLAGLIAEQLIDLEYSVLIVDPEGDHVGLDTLRPAVVLGDNGPAPPPEIVVNLLKRSDACVILDLSALTSANRRRYLADLPAAVEACRRTYGRPHWVLIDEAHQSIAPTEAALGAIDLAASGYCLITWRPDELPAPFIAGTDMVLAMTTPNPDPQTVDLLAAVSHLPRRDVAERVTGPTGSVVVASRSQPSRLQRAHLASRTTHHLRHEHKYDAEGTPPHRAFWFRNERDQLTGAVAHNLHELETELGHCARGVIRHHARLGDFSRWVNDVFRNRRLAARIGAIESAIQPASGAATVDAARLELIGELHRRHHAQAEFCP
ncbi:MAG: HAD hydrolase family protein [Acidimicrobiia bacterium]|nr:HAD hydrolase family protein [Acidimicrobiia bacterium]